MTGPCWATAPRMKPKPTGMNHIWPPEQTETRSEISNSTQRVIRRCVRTRLSRAPTWSSAAAMSAAEVSSTRVTKLPIPTNSNLSK